MLVSNIENSIFNGSLICLICNYKKRRNKKIVNFAAYVHMWTAIFVYIQSIFGKDCVLLYYIPNMNDLLFSMA